MESKAIVCVFLTIVVAISFVDCSNSGKFQNCGSVPFNVTWSPQPISPSKPLKLSVDYTVPHNIKGGTYNITIWFNGDKYPFLQFVDTFVCDDVKKYIPCPLIKGIHITETKVFQHILNVGSYPGDYIIRAEVFNEEHQQMVCLKGNVIILKN